MSALVVCHLLSNIERMLMSYEDQCRLSLQCRNEIARFRSSNRPVCHYLLSWPYKPGLLIDCPAQRLEPVFYEPSNSLFSNYQFMDFVLEASSSRMTLIGAIPGHLYADAMRHAETIGLIFSDRQSEALWIDYRRQPRRVGNG